MPGLNGYEVARRIRASSWGSELSMVAITGWEKAEGAQRARDAGFDRNFVTPTDEKTLLALIVDLDDSRRRT